ncbi:DUF4180 domain-containing protein [Lachnospiraceae bacterium OttesenSCG-928-D06]|nr:DUF4180 domain-containing protein [Lachnospiraceae bacterium OttesenSCG-928-D06]
METEQKIEKKSGQYGEIAVVNLDDNHITSAAEGMDFLISLSYNSGCNRVVFNKEGFSEDFFVLSTKILGELLQKCVNYNLKLAIYGDYSVYTSKPLKDFIYESNNGKDFFFVNSKEEAVERLSKV